jgi:hypothetical protein
MERRPGQHRPQPEQNQSAREAREGSLGLPIAPQEQLNPQQESPENQPFHTEVDNLTEREGRIVNALIEAFARYHGTWTRDKYNTYKRDPEKAEIGRKNISRDVRQFFEEEFKKPQER